MKEATENIKTTQDLPAHRPAKIGHSKFLGLTWFHPSSERWESPPPASTPLFSLSSDLFFRLGSWTSHVPAATQ